MARRFGAVLALSALAACAKVAPPPGGPEDRTPPEILSVSPSGGASAVDAEAEFVLVFSEKPDQRSVLRALSVFPNVRFGETAWAEDTLRLAAEGGWPSERNTTIRIETTAKDRRGNTIVAPFETWFTTKAVADSGTVTGKIWSGKEVERGMRVLVAAFGVDTQADTLDPVEDEPDAIRAAKPSGAFELGGLDTGRSYRLIAIADRDGDGRPGSRGETWSFAPGTITFDSSATHAVPDFLLGTLDSLGTITGEVLADSGRVPSVFAIDDSTAGAERFYEEVRRGTEFSLKVPTGAAYRVAAFVDLDGDSLAGDGEPFVETESLVPLTLTSERGGLKFDLRSILESDSTDTSVFDVPAPAESSSASPDSLEAPK